MNSFLGTIQTMKVDSKTKTGYVLTNTGIEAVLPHEETDTELDPGEQVNVFLYSDKQGRWIATLALPAVQKEKYDWAEVKEAVPNLGVFVDIGTNKEILVSKDDLPLFESVWPAAGDVLYVTLGEDQKGRLLAIPADENALMNEFEAARENLYQQPITGRVYHTSKEGAAIFTEGNHRGFIHHSERKEEPRLGELINGRVIEVKEDGSINVSLRPLKQHSIGSDAETILEHLEANNGVIPLSDKSDPEDIRATFQISKAAFKRALGSLMKEGKIEQINGNTYMRGNK
ncbi:S1 RNA-binding domain-containing protein [Virgibacillus oceani]